LVASLVDKEEWVHFHDGNIFNQMEKKKKKKQKKIIEKRKLWKQLKKEKRGICTNKESETGF